MWVSLALTFVAELRVDIDSSLAWISTQDADIIRRYLGDASRRPIDEAEIQRRRVQKARRDIEAHRRRK